jgi:hypothetical protein
MISRLLPFWPAERAVLNAPSVKGGELILPRLRGAEKIDNVHRAVCLLQLRKMLVERWLCSVRRSSDGNFLLIGQEAGGLLPEDRD